MWLLTRTCTTFSIHLNFAILKKDLWNVNKPLDRNLDVVIDKLDLRNLPGLLDLGHVGHLDLLDDWQINQLLRAS